ncbi:protein vein isoform X2 [Plutella xylostella]|uniref:protein vein isoform X2 n=1 Tax=Plutella xylostella TaxID=51655 RepID=UPI0018D1D246|nr:protein vein isoform X2 [Plutella xylostella]
MRTSGAACWALQLLACFTLGLAAPRSHYCERADVAWRAYRAPAAFEARVQSLAGDRLATLQVRRVLRRQGGWPRRHAVLRLRLPPTDKDACTGRFEVPLKNRQNYIIFAERAGHMAVALGPPLRRTRKLLRRIRAVYAPGYIRQAKVEPMHSVRTTPGSGVRLECRATARPPPRITWYRDGRPVTEIALRRLRVLNYRRRSVLTIKHAKLADSATYECRAQGAIGPPAITSANVSVLPPAPDISYSSPCPMPGPTTFCLNGGTCLYFEQVQEAACKCPEGFNGQRCENKEASNRSIMEGSD